MKAIILAAGIGRRLRPLTDLLPKALLPIGGRPVLAILLESLREASVHEVRIVVGHLADRIEGFVGDGSRFGMDVRYCEQREQRGTGHAVLEAASFIDQNVMVLAGDTVLSVDHLRRLSAFHRENGADASLCLKRVSPEVMARTSSVVLEADGRVADFVEKPELGKAPGELAAAMFQIHTPALLEPLGEISESSRGELELTDAVRAMIASGRRVVGLELPTPPDLTDASDFLKLNFEYARNLLES